MGEGAEVKELPPYFWKHSLFFQTQPKKKKRLRHFRVPSFSLIGGTPPRPRARRALPLQGARLEALPHGPGGRKGRPQASWGETAPGSQHLRQGPLLPPRVRRRHFPGIRPPGKGRPHFQKRNFHSAPGSLTQPPPDSAPFPLHIQGSRAVLGEVCVGVGWGVLYPQPDPPRAQTGLRAAEVEGAGHHVALSGPLDTLAASSGQSRAGPGPSCPAVITCRGIPWAAAARQAWPRMQMVA